MKHFGVLLTIICRERVPPSRETRKGKSTENRPLCSSRLRYTVFKNQMGLIKEAITMKKILAITTIIMLMLSSCTYKNSEMYNKLTKQYPDSEIIKSGGNFKVISNSPEIDQNIKKNINTSGCAMIYETVEELQDSMNVVTCLVFKGVKTTTSKQCITYWQENDWKSK